MKHRHHKLSQFLSLLVAILLISPISTQNNDSSPDTTVIITDGDGATDDATIIADGTITIPIVDPIIGPINEGDDVIIDETPSFQVRLFNIPPVQVADSVRHRCKYEKLMVGSRQLSFECQYWHPNEFFTDFAVLAQHRQFWGEVHGVSAKITDTPGVTFYPRSEAQTQTESFYQNRLIQQLDNGLSNEYDIIAPYMRDPCLVYSAHEVCAMCRFGAIRIFTAENQILCGFGRKLPNLQSTDDKWNYVAYPQYFDQSQQNSWLNIEDLRLETDMGQYYFSERFVPGHIFVDNYYLFRKYESVIVQQFDEVGGNWIRQFAAQNSISPDLFSKDYLVRFFAHAYGVDPTFAQSQQAEYPMHQHFRSSESMRSFRQNIVDYQYKQREIRRYYNSTSGVMEEIGFESIGQVDPKSCAILYNSQLSESTKMSKEQILIAKYIPGCLKCKPGFISQIDIQERTGFEIQTCRPFQNATESSHASQDTPCDSNGLWWPRKGDISAIGEQPVDLMCTQCSQLIPNCIACSNSRTCQVCMPPMRLVKIYDSEGLQNTVCMDRCRFRGKGGECEEEMTLKNCIRSEYLSFQYFKNFRENYAPGVNQPEKQAKFDRMLENLESCVVPAHGYQLQDIEGEFVYDIQEFGNQATIDFHQFLRDLFNVKVKKAIKIEEIAIQAETVRRIVIPETNFLENLENQFITPVENDQTNTVYIYNYIIEAINSVFTESRIFSCPEDTFCAEQHQWYDLTTQTYNKPVRLEIYLAKGEHFWLSCIFQPNADETSTQPLNLSPWCQDSNPPISYWNYRRRYIPLTDNVELIIRPLDCVDYEKTWVQTAFELDVYAFSRACNHLNLGEKPKIRMQNSFEIFNITSTATFENIEFTGEDLMAETYKYVSDAQSVPISGIEEIEDQLRFQTPQGKLGFIPMKKCEVKSDPSHTISELEVRSVSSFNFAWEDLNQRCYPNTCVGEYIGREYSNLGYRCSFGLLEGSQNELRPPLNKVDQCENEDYDFVSPTGDVFGEPYSPSFFKQIKFSPFSNPNEFLTIPRQQGDVHPERHKTLFNLFNFDRLRSTKDHPVSLTLKNCDFKYFLGSLDSLVNIETNNLSIIEQHDLVDDWTGLGAEKYSYLYLGEDRAANIRVEGCSFSHSNFKKGLIYYKEMEAVKFHDDPRFLNMTAQTPPTPINETQEEYDKRIKFALETDEYHLPKIFIANSTFKNLGYQQVIKSLTQTEYGLRQKLTPIQSTNDPTPQNLKFGVFANQGQILNTQGFHGSVEISQNFFNKNIAYIKDILIEPNPVDFVFTNTAPDQLAVEFMPLTNYLQFRVCSDNQEKFFFNDAIDPSEPFQDSQLVTQFETYSQFFISEHSGPIIFENNEFKENIGTAGGAIHISNLRFNQTLEEGHDSQPAIVLHKNTFENNMAYFAGNAFFIQMAEVQVESEFGQVCGAGILIDDNKFEGNVGLKRHNGGAGVIRCLHADSEAELKKFGGQNAAMTIRRPFVEHRSVFGPKTREELLLMHSNHTVESLATNTTYLRSPNQQRAYPLLSYGTMISNNFFSKNYAGMKGSSLLIEGLNELQIVDNKFMNNGPVNTYAEQLQSPYFRLFQSKLNHNGHTLSLTVPWNFASRLNCDDEASYFANCWRSDLCIDMPSLQGSIYVQGCSNKRSCFVNDKIRDEIISHRPSYSAAIKGNIFVDNFANVVLQDNQKMPQASSIYLEGIQKSRIVQNEFRGHKGGFSAQMELKAENIFSYYPRNYFKNSHAPIIRVQNPSIGNYLSQTSEGTAFQTDFVENSFVDNWNSQILLRDSQTHYSGSLVSHESDEQNSLVKIEGNIVEQNQMTGKKGSIFFIKGSGGTKILRNDIRYNGYLSLQQNTSPVGKTRHDYLQDKEYESLQGQEKGVFIFDRGLQMNEPLVEVSHNSFQHVYCTSGCLFSTQGGTSIFNFSNNFYSSIVSSEGGSIFQQGTTSSEDVLEEGQSRLLSWEMEEFSFIFGGAIQVKNSQADAILFKNCSFYNNFAGNNFGAAISITNGGFIAENTHFSMNSNLYSILKKENDFGQIVDLSNKMLNTKSALLAQTYDHSLPQNKLLDSSALKMLNELQNDSGQLRLQNVKGGEEEAMKKLSKRAKPQSVLNNVTFKDLVGGQSSAIALYNSELIVIGSKTNKYNLLVANDFIARNVAIFGSPIRLHSNSTLSIVRQLFQSNMGATGGVFSISGPNSQIHETNSIFENNFAELGGIFYGHGTNSTAYFSKSSFESNFGEKGSLIVAQSMEKVTLDEVYAHKNLAMDSTISILNTKLDLFSCNFTDCFSVYGSQGLSLELGAQLIAKNSNFSQPNDIRNLSKKFESQKELIDNFQPQFGFIKSQEAKGISLENVIVEASHGDLQLVGLISNTIDQVSIKNSRFINNVGSSEASVFTFKGPQVVVMDHIESQQSNHAFITARESHIKLQNSQISENQAYIDADSSYILLNNTDLKGKISQNETFNNSFGIKCFNCQGIDVQNSKFSNFMSTQGSAIEVNFTSDLARQKQSQIINSSFDYNSATKRGGAIFIGGSNQMKIDRNTFNENSAQENLNSIYPRIGNSDAGAIFTECDQSIYNFKCNVILTNNIFDNNRAKHTAGAIQWVNFDFKDSNQSFGRNLQKQLEGQSNLFNGNTAKFQNDWASYAQSVQMKYWNKREGKKTLVNFDNIVLNVTPGQPYTFQFSLYDDYEQIYKEALGSTGTFRNQKVTKSTDLQVVNPGSVLSRGRFIFQDVKFLMAPGSTQQVQLDFSDFDTFGIEALSPLKDTLNATVIAKDCTDQERELVNACLPCQQPGLRYFEIGLFGECEELRKRYPEAGYWRNDIQHDFSKCGNFYACLEGSPEMPLYNCADGYRGFLCQTCDKDFYHTTKSECAPCESLWFTIFKLVLFWFVYSAAIVFLVYGIWSSRQLSQTHWLPLVRILFNHLILLAILSKLLTEWPWGISELFYWMQDPVQIECILRQWPLFRHSQIKLFVAAFLPLLLSLKAKVLIWCVNQRHFINILEERSDLEKLFRLVALYISFPWIIFRVVESFNCTYLIGSESMQLNDDLEVECFSALHTFMTILFTVPALVLWAFGAPIIQYKSMQTKMRKFKEQGEKNMEFAQEKTIAQFRLQNVLLYSGLKDRHFYWEIILLIRQSLLLTVISLTRNTDSFSLQAQFFIWILTAFIVTIGLVQPYEVKWLNRLEAFSLVTTLSSIFLVICNRAWNEDEKIDDWFIGLQFYILQALFILYALKQVRFLLLYYCAEHRPDLFSLVNFGCSNITLNEFRSKYMAELSENDTQISDIIAEEENIEGKKDMQINSLHEVRQKIAGGNLKSDFQDSITPSSMALISPDLGYYDQSDDIFQKNSEDDSIQIAKKTTPSRLQIGQKAEVELEQLDLRSQPNSNETSTSQTAGQNSRHSTGSQNRKEVRQSWNVKKGAIQNFQYHHELQFKGEQAIVSPRTFAKPQQLISEERTSESEEISDEQKTPKMTGKRVERKGSEKVRHLLRSFGSSSSISSHDSEIVDPLENQNQFQTQSISVMQMMGKQRSEIVKIGNENFETVQQNGQVKQAWGEVQNSQNPQNLLEKALRNAINSPKESEHQKKQLILGQDKILQQPQLLISDVDKSSLNPLIDIDQATDSVKEQPNASFLNKIASGRNQIQIQQIESDRQEVRQRNSRGLQSFKLDKDGQRMSNTRRNIFSQERPRRDSSSKRKENIEKINNSSKLIRPQTDDRLQGYRKNLQVRKNIQRESQRYSRLESESEQIQSIIKPETRSKRFEESKDPQILNDDLNYEYKSSLRDKSSKLRRSYNSRPRSKKSRDFSMLGSTKNSQKNNKQERAGKDIDQKQIAIEKNFRSLSPKINPDDQINPNKQERIKRKYIIKH